METNPYDVLGVSNSDDKETIKKKFKRLVSIYHPDVGGDKAKFIKIKSAYDQIIGSVATSQNVVLDRVKTSYDVYVKCSLRQSINGFKRNFIIQNFPKKCPVCNGSTRHETDVNPPCMICGGTGYRVMDSSIQNCTFCNGTGFMSTVTCSACSGKGYKKSTLDVTLDFKPGIRNHDEVVYNTDGVDLYFIVEIEKDDRFERIGDDLKTDVDIFYKDMLDEKTITVESINKSFNLKLQPVDCGDIIRVQGGGVNGGDLLVKVRILMK